MVYTKNLLFIILVVFLFIYFIINKNKLEYFNNFKSYNVLYINLDQRTDRKKELLSQFKKFKNKNIKINIERISAVKHKKGQIGCAKSHIKCLKSAKKRNLEEVIICEDDINIHSNLINKYFEIINKLNDWDVIILSGHGDKKNINNFISKALGIQTTGLYLVKNHYYDKLINNFEESVIEMEKRYKINKDIMCPKWCIDINWKKLQKKDNWYIFNKNLGYQRSDFSDIEKKKINYNKFLN